MERCSVFANIFSLSTSLQTLSWSPPHMDNSSSAPSSPNPGHEHFTYSDKCHFSIFGNSTTSDCVSSRTVCDIPMHTTIRFFAPFGVCLSSVSVLNTCRTPSADPNRVSPLGYSDKSWMYTFSRPSPLAMASTYWSAMSMVSLQRKMKFTDPMLLPMTAFFKSMNSMSILLCRGPCAHQVVFHQRPLVHP